MFPVHFDTHIPFFRVYVLHYYSHLTFVFPFFPITCSILRSIFQCCFDAGESESVTVLDQKIPHRMKSDHDGDVTLPSAHHGPARR